MSSNLPYKIVEKSELCMGTTVTIKLITSGDDGEAERKIEHAFKIFRDTEIICSRFDQHSELMQLCNQPGQKVHVSPILFETLQFATACAVLTKGRFDPTVGQQMAEEGFDTQYLTREKTYTGESDPSATFHDIELDPDSQTVLLKKKMILDLGAVAKGFAVDLAARSLWPESDFSINAGGDLYVSGKNHHGNLWKIGIQHPVKKNETLYQLKLSQMAVCTSGSYERRSPVHPTHDHIIRDWSESSLPVSATVIAPYAMMADAFSTVLMTLPLDEGLSFIKEQGVEGLVITTEGELKATEGMKDYDGKSGSVY